jgi:hypothetical protein
MPRFKDRKEAGEALAEQLKEYKDKNAVIVALPRGIQLLYSSLPFPSLPFPSLPFPSLPFPLFHPSPIIPLCPLLTSAASPFPSFLQSSTTKISYLFLRRCACSMVCY